MNEILFYTIQCVFCQVVPPNFKEYITGKFAEKEYGTNDNKKWQGD